MLYILITVIVAMAAALGATLGHRVGYARGQRNGRKKLLTLLSRMVPLMPRFAPLARRYTLATRPPSPTEGQMNETDADWIDTLTTEQRQNAAHHLRDLIEQEGCYPMHVLAVLRALPAHELRTVVNVFEQMSTERAALAAQREV